MTSNLSVFFGDFSFSLESRELFLKGKYLPLQPKQAHLLAILLRNRGNLVTREQIQQAVWPNQVLEFDQSINFSIKCIRQALHDDPKQPQFIQTVPRRGYRFIAQVKNDDELNHDEEKSNWIDRHKALIRYFFAPIVGFLFITVSGYWWNKGDFQQQETIFENQAEESKQTERLASTDFKRALFLFNKADYHSRVRSRELFEKALVVKPDEAITHAYLGMVYMLLASNAEDFSKAREHLQTARHLKGAETETLMAEGMIALYGDWDIPLANQLMKTVADRRPDWSLVWHELAVTEAILGDYESATASIEHLLNIDPGAAQERFHAGWFYMVSGQWDEALKQCKQAVELNPQHHSSLICVARAATELGLHQIAVNSYSQVIDDLAPEDKKENLKIQIGKYHYAAFYKWMIELQKSYNAGPFSLALTYASFGDSANALAQLRQARDQRDGMFATAWAFPEFAYLRGRVEFIEIMGSVKLTRE